MDDKFRKLAEQFIRDETQFHLGFLPTEQSNPKSKTLEADFNESAEKGVGCLQRIDRDVLEMVGRVMASDRFASLIDKGLETVRNGGRIIFSGCGATGRLSILLEAMWRNHCALNPDAAKYADNVESIMTGGDYALVRSVEFFEDFASFGRRQVQEANMCKDDILVAITEGGETSSVLGTVAEALDRGCDVFLLFNNPADVLAAHLERSRQAIEDPRVCVLDLFCGPMALAGSTRMQATTSEQLVAGAALETIMHKLTGKAPIDYVAEFARLLDCLEAKDSVEAIAGYMRLEADIYRNKGKVTYFADSFLLDIFTDTTERSPTFMLPPFRKCDDKKSPAPWTFVKNPLHCTDEAWQLGMRRNLRCLNWTPEDYTAMGAGDKIAKRPPALTAADLKKFLIGNEDVDERCDSGKDAAVLVTVGKTPDCLAASFGELSPKFSKSAHLAILTSDCTVDEGDFKVWVNCAEGALDLMRHMAIKLVLNTVSTGTMALLGRIRGNWMSWVDCTNKKLLDRGTRLLVELAEVDYRTACETLFEALDALEKISGEKPSPVQLALGWLRRKDISGIAEYLEKMDGGWKLAIGAGKGGMSYVTPDQMLNKKVNTSEDGRQITVVYSGHALYGKEFTVITEWKQQDDGRYAARISYKNYTGTDWIEEIHFPIVKSEVDDASKLFQATWDMGYTRDMVVFAPGSTQRNNVMSMQFGSIINQYGQSCYFDWRDSSWTLKSFDITRSADGRTLSVGGVYYVPMDEKPACWGEVPYECSIKLYKGSWFDATQFYKAWALNQSWWTKQPKDNPLRNIGMWVWNRGAIQDVIPTVERLQKDLGTTRVALDWYWWHSNPYDTDYPNFWPPREGEDAFKAAVARLNEQGIYSQVYVNGVCWDHDGRNWNEGGDKGVVVNRDGSILEVAFNKYNHHRLAWQCGVSDKYQDKLTEVVGKLHDCGLTGQYLDMIGCASYHPCYNPEHKHPKGGGTYVVDGFHNMVRRIRSENPGYILTTETANEAYMDVFEGGIICASASREHLGGGDIDIVPAFTAVYHGRFASFGTYAHPDGIPPWDPLWPDEDRWQNEKPWHKIYPDQFFVELARTVVWGAQPMVCHIRPRVQEDSEFEDIYKFILDTGKFYYDNRDFLYDGDMMSPDGFTCATKDVEFLARMIFTTEKTARVVKKTLPCVLHGCWRNPDGKYALFMANYTADEQAWSFRGKSGVIAPHSYMKVDY